MIHFCPSRSFEFHIQIKAKYQGKMGFSSFPILSFSCPQCYQKWKVWAKKSPLPSLWNLNTFPLLGLDATCIFSRILLFSIQKMSEKVGRWKQKMSPLSVARKTSSVDSCPAHSLVHNPGVSLQAVSMLLRRHELKPQYKMKGAFNFTEHKKSASAATQKLGFDAQMGICLCL